MKMSFGMQIIMEVSYKLIFDGDGQAFSKFPK